MLEKTTLFCVSLTLSVFFYGVLFLRFKRLTPRARAITGVLGFVFSLAMGGIGLFYPR
jgi:hypothetical protein